MHRGAGGLTALVVDDGAGGAERFAERLDGADERIETLVVPDGSRALDRLEEVDCVVVSTQSPETDGLDLIEMIADAEPERPVVALSGLVDHPEDGPSVSEGDGPEVRDVLDAGAIDCAPVPADADEAVLLTNRLRVIVDRERATSAARKSWRRYGRLLETAPAAILIHDADGEVVYANPAAVALCGGDAPTDLVGRSLQDLAAGDTARTVRQSVERVIDDRDSVERVGFELDQLDEGVRYVELAVSPITVDDEPAGQAILVDVTTTKERERALTGLHDVATDLERCESVEEVCERTIVAAERVLSFDACTMSIEEDGQLPAKATSSGLDEEQTTTMSVEEGLTGKTYRTGESYLLEDLSEVPEARPQGPFTSALSIPIGDHGVFQVVSEEQGFFDEADLELAELLVAHTAGALTRIASQRDLREERERLRRQNERLDQFASVVSHDLQSPLTVAKGNLHLTRVHEDDTYLEETDAALNRMEDIIDDLLALARSGERATDLDPVEINAVAAEAWTSVPHVGGDLRTECDGIVLADRSRLRGLLENLLRNAVTHAGPNVTVEIGRLDDESGFYVADDGPGIPPDQREVIFEAGFTTSQDGSGLGLLIVREIAQAHGWDVRSTDSRWGGARFEVTGVEQVNGERADGEPAGGERADGEQG